MNLHYHFDALDLSTRITNTKPMMIVRSAKGETPFYPKKGGGERKKKERKKEKKKSL